MAVYDCFMFYNELDMLEIRLNVLKDYVDFFVITESNRTHTGLPKPFNLADNYERFSAFHHKIIYLKLDNDNLAEGAAKNPWILENYQRLQLMQGLSDASQNDTILLSDLDEIPNPDVIGSFSEANNYGICMQQHHNYYLNFLQIAPKPKSEELKNLWYSLNGYSRKPFTKYPAWLGTCIFKKQFLEKYTLQDLRNISRAKRIKGKYIPNGGWHFSYMGDINFITKKLASYAHAEYNTNAINSETYIKARIAAGQSLFDEVSKFELIAPDSELLPAWLRENYKSYPHLIANK
ncbi:MAG: hypothetical protein ACOVMN_03535 [Flexibacteraceae bacterium]